MIWMTADKPGWRDPAAHAGADAHMRKLMHLLGMRIPYLRNRTERLERSAKVYAAAFRMPPDEAYALSLAARFHDVGLLGVPDAILLKPSPLTEEERKAFDYHADVGGRLIASIFPGFPDAAEGIWWHHERYDGKGPHGMKAEEIPLIAAIVGFLQAVEAMANGRPFRQAMSLPEIREEVRRNKGVQFAPHVVDVFEHQAKNLYTLLVSQTASPFSSRPAGGSSPSGSPAPSEATRSASEGSSAPARAPVSQPISDIDDLQPVITKKELVRLVTEGLKLRPLSGTAQLVLSTTANAQCTVEDVAQAVETDQALSLRLLKLANSTAYARGRPVDTVLEAVKRIGNTEVRNIVLAISMLDRFHGRIARYIDPWLFWEHAIASGWLARSLAHSSGQARDEEGSYFLWGVLHDVGRLLFLDSVPDQYAEVYEAAEKRRLPLEQVETRMLLMDHGSVLARAMEHWNFPQELITPVVNHHEPLHKMRRLGPKFVQPAAFIALADRLAHALMIGCSGNDALYPLEDLADLAGATRDALLDAVKQAYDQTRTLKMTLLARTHTDAWPDFCEQTRQRLSRPVRAVHAAMRPEWNPFALFFGRLRGKNVDIAPNLGVIYLYDTRDQPTVLSAYEKAERRAGVENLPVLIVHTKGKVNGDDAWIRARTSVILRTPVRVGALLAAVEDLLGRTTAVTAQPVPV
ncbi:MAG: HDOD domain-containing protein [Planctomycetota bacterium]|nr:MAG: HDOD domain-containing protein [Planctomycetota bacterium]